MKWLLILFLSDANGDYAITTVMESRAICAAVGEQILADARRLNVPGTAQAYQCWPTDPAQVAYIADGATS